MRPRDPLLAFILHSVMALVACGVGSVAGAWLQDDGTMSLVRQVAPVVLVAGIAGYAANQWSQSRAAGWIWIPAAALLAWLLAGEAYGWTDRTASQIVTYVWNQFIGPHCGETECIDIMLGTAPFAGAVAYSLAARSARASAASK
jgi:hypothetical protein